MDFTSEFKQEYSLRSGIEGTISQGIRGFNLRQQYPDLGSTSYKLTMPRLTATITA
jgi:hypothetical protein